MSCLDAGQLGRTLLFRFNNVFYNTFKEFHHFPLPYQERLNSLGVRTSVKIHSFFGSVIFSRGRKIFRLQ